MKKKQFALSGILKIREYKETLALQEFLEKTKYDRQLLSEYNDIQTSKTKALQQTNTNTMRFEQMQYAHSYIGSCNATQKNIAAKRDEIKPAVTQAHNEYNAVRLALESVKILQDQHKIAQKKMKMKDFYNQIQEGVLL